MDDERKRIRCLIRGEVQGVGFRWSTRERARDLGLTGYVRNLPDGQVEIVAEGPESALETMKTFCYRGAHGARVTDANITDESATGEFRDFDAV